ncbi:MAG: hypothetical protein A2Y82_02085 [Candidatus Buchananbacteria bacterium RBG_13_36_9]|uniref:CMP/dCMP-type deaminase domain-containing protein n=1 Tax=Candidatus Buchananbacteria bacterium RBG_13_36_9 TaxID=1797530 RepID=A0A1G1XPC1_9BACT|nr:MAG: hypothetical protein A2Y82_02085 [Candidatus Buchananbacteria bacterium RBG_13_36_9]
MKMAISASLRSGCVRDCIKGSAGQFQRDEKGLLINQTHRFGCVIVKDDNAVSIGFNGPAPGQPLCTKVGCQRAAEKIPSGTQIEQGRCIHAEWMAITKMLKSGVGCSTDGATMYVTAEPCLICAKIIACLGLKDLVVLEGNYQNNGIKIVKAAGIDVRFVKKSDL